MTGKGWTGETQDLEIDCHHHSVFRNWLNVNVIKRPNRGKKKKVWFRL